MGVRTEGKREVCMRAKSLQTLGTPWIVANKAPLSIGCAGKNAGVGCSVLLQGIFQTQGSNLRLFCLQHWRAGRIFTSSATCVLSRSVVSDSATPRSVNHQAPLPMGILQARILE